MIKQPIKLNYQPIPLGEFDFFNLEPYFLKFLFSRLGVKKVQDLAYFEVDYNINTENEFGEVESFDSLGYVSQFLYVKETFKKVILENGNVGSCYVGYFNGRKVVLFQGEENVVYGYGLLSDQYKADTITNYGDYNVKDFL